MLLLAIHERMERHVIVLLDHVRDYLIRSIEEKLNDLGERLSDEVEACALVVSEALSDLAHAYPALAIKVETNPRPRETNKQTKKERK